MIYVDLQILKGQFLSHIFTNRIVSNAESNELNTNCNEKYVYTAFTKWNKPM